MPMNVHFAQTVSKTNLKMFAQIVVAGLKNAPLDRVLHEETVSA